MRGAMTKVAPGSAHRRVHPHGHAPAEAGLVLGMVRVEGRIETGAAATVRVAQAQRGERGVLEDGVHQDLELRRLVGGVLVGLQRRDVLRNGHPQGAVEVGVRSDGDPPLRRRQHSVVAQRAMGDLDVIFDDEVANRDLVVATPERDRFAERHQYVEGLLHRRGRLAGQGDGQGRRNGIGRLGARIALVNDILRHHEGDGLGVLGDSYPDEVENILAIGLASNLGDGAAGERDVILRESRDGRGTLEKHPHDQDTPNRRRVGRGAVAVDRLQHGLHVAIGPRQRRPGYLQSGRGTPRGERLVFLECVGVRHHDADRAGLGTDPVRGGGLDGDGERVVGGVDHPRSRACSRLPARSARRPGTSPYASAGCPS